MVWELRQKARDELPVGEPMTVVIDDTLPYGCDADGTLPLNMDVGEVSMAVAVAMEKERQDSLPDCVPPTQPDEPDFPMEPSQPEVPVPYLVRYLSYFRHFEVNAIHGVNTLLNINTFSRFKRL